MQASFINRTFVQGTKCTQPGTDNRRSARSIRRNFKKVVCTKSTTNSQPSSHKEKFQTEEDQYSEEPSTLQPVYIKRDNYLKVIAKLIFQDAP